ncbi:hypothetical protein BGZ82_006277 [Podila clonocystis]|nr:hypothetical protein BGZ82_006277 [Podila clonocystis]
MNFHSNTTDIKKAIAGPGTRNNSQVALNNITMMDSTVSQGHVSFTPSATNQSASASTSTKTSYTTAAATKEVPEALKADFSITLQSESTSTLNTTFQMLMDTIHAIPGLAIRGPIRLPKEGKMHSRRVDLKSIPEKQLRHIAVQSGISLSEEPGVEQTQPSGVVVSFDIE